MANHKRGRCKNSRSGCLMCKYHKSNSFKDTWDAQTWQEKKARVSEREQVRDLGGVS
jgi:hypothetical protein